MHGTAPIPCSLLSCDGPSLPSQPPLNLVIALCHPLPPLVFLQDTSPLTGQFQELSGQPPRWLHLVGALLLHLPPLPFWTKSILFSYSGNAHGLTTR